MPAILSLEEIQAALPEVDVLAAMEKAFSDYSAQRAVVPPVGELLFSDPPGDVHIKYGYLHGDDCYVIKVASGFYHNPQLGLPTSDGLMLLFNRLTGELLAVLLDRGHLTDVRTAAAGAVAARYLAPPDPACIGVIGTGVQAELQLRFLVQVCDCKRAMVCGRSDASLEGFLQRMANSDFAIETTREAEAVAAQCSLIVTTTPARDPWLHTIRAGTHITAVGSDTPDKQELAAPLLAGADLVVVDSLAQSRSRGEVYRARQLGALEEGRVIELGAIVSGTADGRTGEQQVTIADLTGVATQDLEIARAIYAAHQSGRTGDADRNL